METINEDNQLIAVRKVLEEMQYAERILNSWNAFWLEEYKQVVLPQEYFDDFIYDYFKLSDEDKAENSKIDKHTSMEEYNGIPLRHIMLGGKYSCDVSTIDWYGIETNNSIRELVFHNNGDINLHKGSIKKKTKAHPTTISYDANYNVLSTDFDISITLENLNNKYTNLTFSLKDNNLIEKYNDIEIIRDLNTWTKLIRIIKKHDKRDGQNNASVTFETALNPDDSFKYGAVTIETHKGNGKVNGTYRFDVSRKKGIRANYYSRKGVKIDLFSNPELLGTANNLLLTANNSSSGDILVSNFANSAQETIEKNLSKKVISFDNSDFNMEAVIQTEKRVLEMVRCIRGELPLLGLINRIDNCLEIIDKKQNLQIVEGSNYKGLKLESQNKCKCLST